MEYDVGMDIRMSLRSLRSRAGLTTRELAARAGTSHATISAYEHGQKVPGSDTLDRIATAAGGVVLVRPEGGGFSGSAHAREFLDALLLTEHLPARHRQTLSYPVFPGRSA